MKINEVSQGDLPEHGSAVLIWDSFGSGSWQVARFNGPDCPNIDYYWDCDTFGMRQDEVEFWCALPPEPESKR